MDIKRTLLWAVLTISGLMLYNNWLIYDGRQALFGPTPLTPSSQTLSPPKASESVPPAANVTQAQVATPGQSQKSADLPKAESLPTPQQAPAFNVANLASGEKHTIKNDVLELEINTTGASVVSAKLLKQLMPDQKPVALLQITPQNQYFVRSGLISAGSNELPNHTASFAVSKNGRVDNKSFVTFVNERGGVRLEKTYYLVDGSYVVEVEHRITPLNQNNAGGLVLYNEIVRDSSAVSDSEFYSTFTGPALYTDKDKFLKINFSDIEKNKADIPKQIPAGEPGWIAMVQHYFASAWIPSDKSVRDVYVGKVEQNLFRIGLQVPIAAIATGSSYVESTRLFIGPQEETLLEKIAPGFDLIKDYGYLTVIAKPIFWLLEQIHSYVANWGWSIVILTLIIKLVFFPLSAASYKSMARMKEVQPRLMNLREQFKGDPQKLNRAMMDLYKQEKINPLGGCLPVVVQIPVFIALYWVLLSSVEMRNAPWILWIKDLSVPDPYFILPIIMAVSMFVQTRLNPTPPDPLQAKIMLWMPIIFSVMFFFFPAGLVLYWVVNNILSIAQQWQINQMFTKRPAK